MRARAPTIASAYNYVLEFGKAWKDTPGAIAWLIDKAVPVSPKRPPVATRAPKA